MCVYIYIYVYIQLYIYIYNMCISITLSLSLYTYIHIYIYIYTCIHIYKHGIYKSESLQATTASRRWRLQPVPEHGVWQNNSALEKLVKSWSYCQSMSTLCGEIMTHRMVSASQCGRQWRISFARPLVLFKARDISELRVGCSRLACYLTLRPPDGKDIHIYIYIYIILIIMILVMMIIIIIIIIIIVKLTCVYIYVYI